jgi:hypothetical protein
MISEKIASGIKLFINLRSIQFGPVTYHHELFVPSLSILAETNALTEVEVNLSCSDEARAPMLVKLRKLRKLSLISPGRAILQLLPDWLSSLSDTLVELHLRVGYILFEILLSDFRHESRIADPLHQAF